MSSLTWDLQKISCPNLESIQEKHSTRHDCRPGIGKMHTSETLFNILHPAKSCATSAICKLRRSFSQKIHRFHPRNGVLFPRTICIEPNSIKLTIRRPMWPFLICALKTQRRFHHHGATWKFCWKFPLFGSGHRGSFRFWAVTNLGPQIACGMNRTFFL